MKITKLENILNKINGAKYGTRFTFSNGYTLIKTQDDYGFSGTCPCYKLYMGKTYKKFYWAEERTTHARKGLIEDIPTFGYLNNIEEREDGYRRNPMFT